MKGKSTIFIGRGFEVEKAEWTIVSSGNKEKSLSNTASIKLKIKGMDETYTAAEGAGPVDALTQALIKAVRQVRPEVDEVRLISFSAFYKNGQKSLKDGAGAEVMVSVDFARSGKTFKAVELSTNILEATFCTLVRGLEALL